MRVPERKEDSPAALIGGLEERAHATHAVPFCLVVSQTFAATKPLSRPLHADQSHISWRRLCRNPGNRPARHPA